MPQQRRSRRGTSRRPPPPNYDVECFTSKDNQGWFEEPEHMEFIYEMHITPKIDVFYRIMEVFDLLGLASILSLPRHIYPDLIREFYANIDNKKGHNGEEIKSFIRGR